MAHEGSIIQVNENNKNWFGCVLIVTEVRCWGVVAMMKIPHRGNVFVRLGHDQYYIVGDCVFGRTDIEM